MQYIYFNYDRVWEEIIQLTDKKIMQYLFCFIFLFFQKSYSM